MVKNTSWGARIGDKIIVSFLLVVTFLCFAPIWHTLVMSFSSSAAASAGMVTLWPVHFNLSSYSQIISDKAFFMAFGVSVQRVLLGGLTNFILTILMAFPLSRSPNEFKLRNVIMWFLVFAMLFKSGLIPIYLTVQGLGLVNSIWALVLPVAVPVFNVILLMNFFRSIPKEIDQAAIMDGSGPWNTLFKIYVPLSVPALATITLFSLVMHWNSFLDGLIYMSKTEDYPLQTYIQQLVVRVNLESMSGEEAARQLEISNKTLNAAKIIVSMTPIVAVYPFIQRYFIHGIMIGSVKE
ncbi:putative aldouronate transport system permease protein [Paenibacillus sp. 1_12]|uniref:carbohydrate ABC transporter permease n=1 Tax=Paenibacillus sp. 1_12 TaxID=1566278 RepID=UPI0008E0B8D8|nr:carbohydrate ABC transporter permease [Paenibacillus sp. 1_12]SFL56182.1 putative aldouronate transport system permease protein [Paenibacillus sp. 1_12]